MHPTKDQIEEKIEELSANIEDIAKQLRTVKDQLKPIWLIAHKSATNLINEAKPQVKKYKLNLEILYLKSRLRLVENKIQTQKKMDG